jgi:DNA-binding transcriptional ArsR family regulator
MSVDPKTTVREITDARTLRALSHPVRIALLEILGIEGPLTATEAGEKIGESSTTCSFHLRQLAKYGFVEEAGGGKGRARPWKRVHGGLSFSSDQADPEAEVVAASLARLFRERQFGRLQTWLETRRSYSKQWRDAATGSDFVMWMTPTEMREFNDELFALMDRHRERAFDPSARPAGAAPVEYLLHAYPMQPAKEDQP